VHGYFPVKSPPSLVAPVAQATLLRRNLADHNAAVRIRVLSLSRCCVADNSGAIGIEADQGVTGAGGNRASETATRAVHGPGVLALTAQARGGDLSRRRRPSSAPRRRVTADGRPGGAAGCRHGSPCWSA
jgi:hypothetical protein